MKLKLRINGKMLLYILGTAFLIYSSAFSYIVFQVRSNNYKNLFHILENKNIDKKNTSQQLFNSYLEESQVISETFSEYEQIPETDRRSIVSNILHKLLQKNIEYSSVWAKFEPFSIDSLNEMHINNNDTVYECFVASYYRVNDTVIEEYKVDSLSDYNNIYSDIKNTPTSKITKPHLHNYIKKENVLEISVISPIIESNRFIGVVGVNILVDSIKQKLNLEEFKDGQCYIINNRGDFIISSDTMKAESFFNYFENIDNQFNIKESINKGVEFSFTAKHPYSSVKTLFMFKPIEISNTVNLYSCISVPVKTIYHNANKSLINIIIISIVGFIIILIVIMSIASSISKPIKETTEVLKKISLGNIKDTQQLQFLFKDEINDLAASINNLENRLKSAAKFAQQIGEGDLNAEYKLLGDKDALGTSLITMQQKLIVAKQAEDEKRIEDEKRDWATHGLAKFEDVIRQYNDDMSKFTMNVIKNIVDYTDVTQIAIYISKQIEDEFADNDTYELKAAIAYNKVVLLNKEFKTGEELLGRAIDENKIIHLLSLPEDYILLSSGMKDDKKPRNLLIIPMHINNVIVGVLELLSFEPFPQYKIDFLEKLSENIASVISSVKISIKTNKLLEQSQQQADELAQHEEEMRQNMEEMQATQEETAKQQEELESYNKAIKDATMIAELDTRGVIIDISKSMGDKYGFNIDIMKGKYLENFIAENKEAQEEYSEFWKEMLLKGSAEREYENTKGNKTIILAEYYNVIEIDGVQSKVILLVIDKTEEKKYDELLKQVDS
jgi:methyl-accepting chemotaxis protein